MLGCLDGAFDVGTASERATSGFARRSSSPQWAMMTSDKGRSLASTGTLAILSRISRPDTTCPKTVCLAFRCGHGARVMKN